MSRPVLVRKKYPKDNPCWVQADYYEVHEDGKVTVEAWGYKFPKRKYHYESGDRFDASVNYVLVKHPIGENWLKVWWV